MSAARQKMQCKCFNALMLVLTVWVGLIASGYGAVVINEVMANALDEDTGEFIELYNTGDAPVDVRDWQFTDGDATDIIQPFAEQDTAIPPKGFALILDAEYAGEYQIPPQTVLLTTKNTTLGDGLQLNDPITLFDDTGITVVDTHTPPLRPKNGVSLERVKVDLGDMPENWRESVDPTGATPGRENSVSGSSMDPPVDLPPKPPDETAQPHALVYINEIMHSPNTKLSQTEWIELFNPNAQSVSLIGWRVVDAAGNTGEVLAETVVADGGFVVLADSKSDFLAQFPDVTHVVEINLPALNNSGDTLTLFDNAEREVDRVSYSGTSVSAKSIERLTFDAGDAWAVSISLEGATPGKVNSRAEAVSGAPKLEISPTPFDPAVSQTTIRYTAATDAVVSLVIFDAAGQTVRVLLDTQEAGGKQMIPWNGRNDAGERVAIGVYICQLVVSEGRNRPAQRATKTIVVAERM